MEYGWKVRCEEERITFGALSRELYYANLLMDEVIAQNTREVWRLLEVHGARADVVVPERGAAVLHVLAGLEAENFAAAVTEAALRTADPDVRSEEGLTPAHVAASYGRCRVLEILLTSGADITLLDYRLLMSAEEHAYKEQQWRAYTMLTTYAAILASEQRLSKYFQPEEQRSGVGSVSGTRTQGTYRTISVANKSKKTRDYGEGRVVEEAESDRMEKTLEVSLDESEMVKKHRRNMETYQFPTHEEESIQNFVDEHSDKSGSTGGESKIETTKRYLEDNLPWLRTLKAETPERKSSSHSWIEREVNSSSSKRIDVDATAQQNSVHQTRSGLGVESVKETRNSRSEESEMYIYGYAESSSKSKHSLRRVATPSDCHKSDVDNLKVISNTMLSKVSRIFLYILKKRHSSYRQLEQ